MKVQKLNNAIEISFKYDPTIVSFVKSLAGRSYNPATKNWLIPIDGAHGSIERLAQRGFTIDSQLWEEVRKDKEQALEVEALSVMHDMDFDTPLPLFPYQKVGSAFLWKIGSGLIGDEPGLGKTIMSLAVIEKSKAIQSLVVCPKAVLWQWEQEIRKFTPHLEPFVATGAIKERKELYKKFQGCEKRKVLIIGYETMRVDNDILQTL